MSDKIISMRNKKEINEDETKKLHERFQQLAAYRGDVITKNNIRNLPGVKEGEIFWVTSESKGYIVSKVDGSKVTIKALDEMATVSTGITIYEMNKSIVEKEPVFDMTNEDEVDDLMSDIITWFTDACPATYYLAYGKDLHYVTLFKKSSKYGFDKKSAKNFIDTFSAVGSLISMDFESDRIEVWLRTKESKAELIYVMVYDDGLVKLS